MSECLLAAPSALRLVESVTCTSLQRASRVCTFATCTHLQGNKAMSFSSYKRTARPSTGKKGRRHLVNSPELQAGGRPTRHRQWSAPRQAVCSSARLRGRTTVEAGGPGSWPAAPHLAGPRRRGRSSARGARRQRGRLGMTWKQVCQMRSRPRSGGGAVRLTHLRAAQRTRREGQEEAPRAGVTHERSRTTHGARADQPRCSCLWQASLARSQWLQQKCELVFCEHILSL